MVAIACAALGGVAHAGGQHGLGQEDPFGGDRRRGEAGERV